METSIEKSRLQELEIVIEKGLYTFVEVGFALLEIRDNKLYKDKHLTFEDYCEKRWSMKQSHAYRFMDAAEVVGNLKSSPIGELLPTNESQTRPLTSLSPEQQILVWQEVLDTAPNGKVTASHVQDVVDRVTRPENLHISDDSYEWYTPEEYIESARLVMGSINLDPASCQEANEIVQAEEFFTQEDDGLEREWFGNVWMNPPYNMPNVENFTKKAHTDYQNKKINEAVVLVNNATDAGWFHTLLENYPVCFTRGRVKYWGPHSSISGARQGQAIFYLGKNKSKFKKHFSQFGIVVEKI